MREQIDKIDGVLARPLGKTRFTTPLFCDHCGQTGFATWEGNLASRWESLTVAAAVCTSDGFYLRENSTMNSGPQIVCSECGTVHRDRV
jgi:hypothetical protein